MLNTILGSFSSGVTVAPSSYESIATATVGGGGSATVTLTSIPSTYTHLQLRFIGKSTLSAGNDADNVAIRFNGDSTAGNYAAHFLYTNGSSVAAVGYTGYNSIILLARSSATGFSTGVVDILDYANTNKYKTVKNLNGWDGSGAGQIWFSSMVWQSTSAINQIEITGLTSGQYTQFALYGIKGE